VEITRGRAHRWGEDEMCKLTFELLLQLFFQDNKILIETRDLYLQDEDNGHVDWSHVRIESGLVLLLLVVLLEEMMMEAEVMIIG